MADSPPRTLGRYEILDEIGRGTMGAVYRARDPALGRMVALKTISIVYAIPQDERESFQERFLMEARTAAVISHPGVVTVFDVGRDTETGTLFIAFEYLQGRTLGDMIGGGVAVEVKEALRLIARVAEALHHAHSCGIIHRDIKPANIMVLPSGEPKIMDFGIAKIRAAQLSLPRQVFGTPMFMSPEQALGGDVDARSDIFSLGSVLYLLLTSRAAFDGGTVPAIVTQLAHQHPKRPSEQVPGLSRDVDYVVGRALAKDPADRYARCQTFAEDLADLRAGRPPGSRAEWKEPLATDSTLVTLLEPSNGAQASPPPTARPQPGAQQLPQKGGRSKALGLAGLALAILAAIAYLALGHRSTRAPAVVISPTAAALAPTAAPTVAPAHLELTLEHSLRGGALKVSIGDDVVLEEALSSRAGVRREAHIVDVAPGEHLIRVEVRGGGDTWISRARGRFSSGARRRLQAVLSGLPGDRRSALVLFPLSAPTTAEEEP